MAGAPLRPTTRGRRRSSSVMGRGCSRALLWMPGPPSPRRTCRVHLVGHPPRGPRPAARARRGREARRARGVHAPRLRERSDRPDPGGGLAALVSARTDAEPRSARAAGGGSASASARSGTVWRRCGPSPSEPRLDEADTGHVPTEDLARRTAAVLDALEDALRWERQRSRGAEDLVVCLAGARTRGRASSTGSPGAPRSCAGE